MARNRAEPVFQRGHHDVSGTTAGRGIPEDCGPCGAVRRTVSFVILTRLKGGREAVHELDGLERYYHERI